jgi:hypothetical protein
MINFANGARNVNFGASIYCVRKQRIFFLRLKDFFGPGAAAEQAKLPSGDTLGRWILPKLNVR